MKKSLIALAVAGVVSAPAFAATSNVDVYGVMNIAIQDTDVTGSDMTILDNTSRVGLKGSEDLGGGLKAIWQIESALGGNGTTAIGSGATLGTRNTFVGLAGGFGTVLMGRHDTPYKLGTGSLDIFGDTIGDYNLGRTDGVSLVNNTHDHRNGQALAYISPTVSGFHAAVAIVMSNGEPGSALNTTDTVDAISATAVYANGPLFASLSFQDADAAAPAADTAWKLGVGYTFGDTKVGFVYEDIEDARDSWLLNVAHTMGPIVLKAQYGQADVGAADQDAWALGADYNLSKRTAAYVVYATGDNDAGSDVSGWNLGVKHSF
jgi:predicted porin